MISIRWLHLGYGWTVNENSKPEKAFSKIGISERDEGRFWEVVELGCAFWRINAEIELDVDLVLEEDDVCMGLDLNF